MNCTIKTVAKDYFKRFLKVIIVNGNYMIQIENNFMHT